ncbi:MAG: SUMF1/EgtB/PvdO family nonheme iron enzyme [Cyanobacteria bacterium]|nr:SUMF1/EgtB/PvdO family nonheme iron enzyme [Cyanobacteria bacterium GSL.Bin1]
MVQVFLQREKRQGKQYREKLGNGVELEMVSIPVGMFVMGSPENELERRDNEGPQHPVTIARSFWMGKYPITQEQWKTVVESIGKINQDLDSEPSHFKEHFEKAGDRWLRPVEQVSWEDAMEFCARLSQMSQKSGRTYRLPSEAEWEYACRGINLEKITVEEWNKKYHQPFHFGETITPDVANYNGTKRYGRGITGKYREQTTPVGYFNAANPFGLYDLHGNVWEWCGDDWEDNYNTPRTQECYKGDINHDLKVKRGGSWYNTPRNCRSAIRFHDFPDNLNLNGFRVVCDRPSTP